jgi:hypothetical protein
VRACADETGSSLKKEIEMEDKKDKRFGPNQWGIKNDSGREITPAYIRAYLECWARIPNGFTGGAGAGKKSRKEIFAIQMSDEWMQKHAKKEDGTFESASDIGRIASMDVELWGTQARTAEKTAKKPSTPTAPATSAPAEQPVAEPVAELTAEQAEFAAAAATPKETLVASGAAGRKARYEKLNKEAKIAA